MWTVNFDRIVTSDELGIIMDKLRELRKEVNDTINELAEETGVEKDVLNSVFELLRHGDYSSRIVDER